MSISMLTYVFSLLIGVTAGLRALTPLAAVSWAARLGHLMLGNTWLAFLGYAATPYITTVLALGEIVNDKMPKTPSRKAPPSFVIRTVMGALTGAAVGASTGSLIIGLIAGAVGAVAGTLGGYEFRSALAKAFGKDLPAALIEDAITIALAVFCSNLA